MTSVPLQSRDVDTLSAYLRVQQVDPGDLSLSPEGTIPLPRVASTPDLRTALDRLGYTYEETERGLAVTGAAPSRATTDPEVAARRQRLDKLNQIAGMPGHDLLVDPDTTDDPRIVKLRERTLRRKLKAELKKRDREFHAKERDEARQARRRKRLDARQERESDRHQRRMERTRMRRQANAERHHARQEEVLDRQNRWETRTENAGRRAILRRKKATTPEHRAAVIERAMKFILIGAALAIISLGVSSTFSVSKFMKSYASADDLYAWSVEPAIILMVVGIQAFRYVRAQNKQKLPPVLVVFEYSLLVGSAFMAGLGAGAGAIVAPIGVAAVAFIAGTMITTLSEMDPEQIGSQDAASRRAAAGRWGRSQQKRKRLSAQLSGERPSGRHDERSPLKGRRRSRERSTLTAHERSVQTSVSAERAVSAQPDERERTAAQASERSPLTTTSPQVNASERPNERLSAQDYEQLLSGERALTAPVEPAAHERPTKGSAEERRALVARFVSENPKITAPELVEKLAEHDHVTSVATVKRDRALTNAGRS